MKVLDLFSGIGGFSLGLERAGMQTVAFCEIDPFGRRVLAKHWPDIPCHDDVTTREFHEGEADVICGGFPCQDISLAGAGAGLSGERSGLYRELVRAIRLVRPRYAIVENVAALLSRGMGTVLGDMAEIGYDAEWHCIPASAVGAPHRRDRVWIVANPDGSRRAARQSATAPMGYGRPAGTESCDAPDAVGEQLRDQSGRRGRPRRSDQTEPGDDGAQEHVADTVGARLEGRPILAGYIAAELAAIERGGEISDAGRDPSERCGSGVGTVGERNWWFSEPDVGRVANGVPARVDRLKGLGNAVVPQIPEAIGRAIMQVDHDIYR